MCCARDTRRRSEINCSPALASRTRTNISRILDSIVGAARYCICGEERSGVSGAEGAAGGSTSMAAPECEREARKRRERRDSGNAHERKERRPHSEERHHHHQQQPAPAPPPQQPPPLHDHNRLEVERRAERLSRARRPQYGKRRRAAPRAPPRAPDENQFLVRDEDPPTCTSPPHPELPYRTACIYREDSLDRAVLHRQLSEEPVVSLAAERARPQLEERPPSPREPHRRDRPQTDKRLDKITKKITSLKRNITRYETDYELRHGQPIDQAERITDVQLTRMYETLRRLQEEKRCIKLDPAEYALKVEVAKQQKERDDKLDVQLGSSKPMAELVQDIEEWLEGCRSVGGRSQVAECSWSAAQLAAEKACVQRALLKLEASRGRPPAHSADRGAARHLYERYRAVKRALAHMSMGGVNGELATIHEHETMLFNSSVDSSSDSQDKPSDASQDTNETPLQSPPNKGDTDEIPSSTSSAKSTTASDEPPAEAPALNTNEGLHCLGLEDLARVLAETKLQKSILRRTIKEYEVSFELENCRKVQRDDKLGREEEYLRYKAVKARIKLLNALINKQKVLT